MSKQMTVLNFYDENEIAQALTGWANDGWRIVAAYAIPSPLMSTKLSSDNMSTKHYVILEKEGE